MIKFGFINGVFSPCKMKAQLLILISKQAITVVGLSWVGQLCISPYKFFIRLNCFLIFGLGLLAIVFGCFGKQAKGPGKIYITSKPLQNDSEEYSLFLMLYCKLGCLDQLTILRRPPQRWSHIIDYCSKNYRKEHMLTHSGLPEGLLMSVTGEQVFQQILPQVFPITCTQIGAINKISAKLIESERLAHPNERQINQVGY